MGYRLQRLWLNISTENPIKGKITKVQKNFLPHALSIGFRNFITGVAKVARAYAQTPIQYEGKRHKRGQKNFSLATLARLDSGPNESLGYATGRKKREIEVENDKVK